MVKGMTLAIEPMVTQGTYDVRVLKDGWTTVMPMASSRRTMKTRF